MAKAGFTESIDRERQVYPTLWELSNLLVVMIYLMAEAQNCLILLIWNDR